MKTKSFLTTMVLFLLCSFLFLSCSKSGSTMNMAGGTTNTTPSVSSNAVSIYNMAFDPNSLTVKVGTTVKWTNNDGVAHTVTSNDGSSFNSGNLSAGASFSYTFTSVGTFNYHCTIHTGMTGTVIVTN